MFDKMKQLMELQKKAKEMQKMLEGIRVEKSEKGVTIALNGAFQVERVSVDEALLTPARKAELEQLLARLFGETAEEVRKRSAAEAMGAMKGMGLPGL
jgi:DNA-binding protein YbaB